jgi:hypothetical protein
MSKILLIEPRRMLQHAFVLALSPEHEIEIAADMKPALTRSSGVDLAIIDAAALRQKSSAPVDVPGTSANWQVPIIWIDTTASSDRPSSGITRLALPFSKEDLRAAVGKLLQAAQPGNDKETGRLQAAAAAPRRGESPRSAPADGDSDKKIIELVDVFEEPDGHNDRSTDADSRD